MLCRSCFVAMIIMFYLLVDRLAPFSDVTATVMLFIYVGPVIFRDRGKVADFAELPT